MANQLQDRYAEMLLEKISRDTYPSTTHMDMLEAVASPRVLVAYTLSLMARIEKEPHPSISMMRRLERLIPLFND